MAEEGIADEMLHIVGCTSVDKKKDLCRVIVISGKNAPKAKLAIVVETASISELELSACSREKALYPEQVQRCKGA